MLPWQSRSTRIERIIMIAYEPGAIAWRKSSFSASNGDCVEVGWRKSSFSNGGSACVEVAHASVGVAVRDSKRPEGDRLAFDQEPWREFLSRL